MEVTKFSDALNWTAVHPADYCLKGALCVGAANTAVAFCSIMGLPARTIGYGGHTCAEVLIDGKWRWVENWVAMEAQTRAPGALYPVSFLEMINDAGSHHATEEFTQKFREFNCVFDDSRSAWIAFNHEGYSNWIFPLTMAYRSSESRPWAQCGLGSLREISALYPELSRIRYKCDQTPRVWLTPFRMPDPRPADWMIVDQNHGIRQEFHLSSLKNVKTVTSCLVIPGGSWTKCYMPEDGGKWFYRINGRKVTVKELGGWNIKHDYQGLGITCLEVVLKPEWLVTSSLSDSR